MPAYPVPAIVQAFRTALHPRLAPNANAWYARIGVEARFLAEQETYLKRCHEAGQIRPTPLLLQYGPGDYNWLHQDLYGDLVFRCRSRSFSPRLSKVARGGEFVLTEQRPRMQRRASVVPLTKGDAVVFAVNSRPVKGARGDCRVALRHGVSTIRAGH